MGMYSSKIVLTCLHFIDKGRISAKTARWSLVQWWCGRGGREKELKGACGVGPDREYNAYPGCSVRWVAKQAYSPQLQKSSSDESDATDAYSMVGNDICTWPGQRCIGERFWNWLKNYSRWGNDDSSRKRMRWITKEVATQCTVHWWGKSKEMQKQHARKEFF